jgi:hypothetical protein
MRFIATVALVASAALLGHAAGASLSFLLFVFSWRRSPGVRGKKESSTPPWRCCYFYPFTDLKTRSLSLFSFRNLKVK